MIKGEENLLKWLEFNQYIYWKILPPKENAEIILSFWPKEEGKEDYTFADGREKMEEALDILAPGKYLVVAKRDTKNDQRNYRITPYQHKMEDNERRFSDRVGMVENTADISEMVRQGVEAELERRDKEAHLQELEKQIKEFKRKDTAYQDAVVSAIGQIMPFVSKYGEQFICGVINALNGNRGAAVISPQIAGTTNNNNKTKTIKVMEQDKSTEQERLQKVVERLEQIEPEKWLDLLEALVATYDNNRAIYDTARSFLLK